MELENYEKQNPYISFAAGYLKCLAEYELYNITRNIEYFKYISIEFELIENKGSIIESLKEHLKENIWDMGYCGKETREDKIKKLVASSGRPSQTPQGCKFWKFGDNQ